MSNIFQLILYLCVTQAELPKEKLFVGYFSDKMVIDSSITNCDAERKALIYQFQTDSSRAALDNSYLYGVVNCRETFNQSLFNSKNRVRVFYREATKQDLGGVTISNARKYFRVNTYIVTRILAGE